MIPIGIICRRLGLSMWGGLALGPVLAVALEHLGGLEATWAAVIGLPGVALTVFALAFLVTRTAGPAINRVGGKRVAVTSVAVEAVGLLIVAAAPSFPAAMAGIVVCGIGVALLYPSMVAITIERDPGGSQGAAVGAMTSFLGPRILVAGPLGGAVAAIAGYPVAFILAAAIAVSAGLLLVLGTRGPRSKSPMGRTLPR